jgi:hypothetical protein
MEASGKVKMGIWKDRLIHNYKSLGASIRLMFGARKNLVHPHKSIYIVLLLMPILSVIFINDAMSALTWMICMFLYIPIIEAYAYATGE